MTRKPVAMRKELYAHPFSSVEIAQADVPVLENPSLKLSRHENFLIGRWFSLSAAFAGLVYTVRTQPNAWIELVAIGVVSLAGWWFRISTVEWAVLGFTSAMILALEAINTAIETVVDLVSPQFHPLARLAKDTAAGALLIAVMGSVVVALCIFGPRIWQLLG